MKYADLLRHLLASPENVVECAEGDTKLRFDGDRFEIRHSLASYWQAFTDSKGRPEAPTPEMAECYEIPKPKLRTFGGIWEECDWSGAMPGDSDGETLAIMQAPAERGGLYWSITRVDGPTPNAIPVRPIGWRKL